MNRFFFIMGVCVIVAGMLIPVVFLSAAGGGGGDDGEANGCNIGRSNVSPTVGEHWAWNDVIGWIDFYYEANPNVEVGVSGLVGCADSNAVGNIALHCASTPNRDICASSDFGVSGGSDGSLAGWAWNDVIGWMSFCGNANGGSTKKGANWQCPSNITYQVFIDSNGDFHGWAWNEIVGWISFNCLNTDTCATVPYKVNTEWISTTPPPSASKLISSVYETCPSDDLYCQFGGALNAILWQGSHNGGQVKFQVASSRCPNGAPDPTITEGNSIVCNDAGAWCEGENCLNCSTSVGFQNDPAGTNSCFLGPDGSPYSYYTANVDTPISVTAPYHQDKRYFRYKVVIDRQAVPGPRVDDVIFNWSR